MAWNWFQPEVWGAELLRTGDVGASRENRRQLWGGSRTPEIAIVGAGFGGIGLGALLVRRGIDTFTIYDKAEHVGGTWWHNQYPGAEVDTVSYVYSYAFKPYGWTRTHAPQEDGRLGAGRAISGRPVNGSEVCKRGRITSPPTSIES